MRLHNRAYREMWQMPETLFTSSATFSDLLDYSRQTGLFGVPDERWEEFANSRIEAVKKGKFPQPELTLTNGKVLQFQCVKLPDGGRMLTYFDITERHQAEQALRDSEERYALVTAAAEEGIYEWSLETDEVYVSPRLNEFLKFEPGELGTNEWPWNDQVHPQDLPHYLDALKRHLEGRDTEWECEYRFSDKTGKYHWILDHGATVRNEHGKVIRLVGAVRDITEQKEASQALRDSEERFKHFAGIAADWFWEIGPDFRFTYSPERHEEITGAKAEQVLGRTPMERLSSRVADNKNLEDYFARLQAHEPFEFEYEWPRPDGTVKHLRNVGKPIFDKDGVFQGYRGVGQDITERKQTLEALRRSEERYALAMQAINEGVYDWNIETGEIYYSPGVRAAFALSPKELKTPQDWLERVHGDDLQAYKDAFAQHFKGETERFVCEYRIHAGDGTLRWARQHGLALRDEHGRAYRMTGSTGDITALRQSEQELKEKTAILETTLESMDQGIAMYDQDLRLSAHNQHWADMLGFSPEFLATRPTLEEIIRDEVRRGIDADLPGDTEDKVRTWMAPVLAAEGPYLSEQHLADGSVLELWTNPLPSGGLVRTVTDVTARR
ncbi:MAG: PAS domain S-box protein, partial [Acidiferrobacterales bacterium]